MKGCCHNCNEFTIRQEEDESLHNGCPISEGFIRMNCENWQRKVKEEEVDIPIDDLEEWGKGPAADAFEDILTLQAMEKIPKI